MTNRARAPWFAAGALATLAGIACASQPERHQSPQQTQLTRAIAPPSRLEPPAYLPGSARAVLRTRMVSHARDMGDLMSAVMLLEYDRVRERAGGIAGDASFARPLTGDATELNSALPVRFFELQDELRGRARTLADAAKRHSAFDVADAYAEVSQTCVRCHATYRQGPEPRPKG
jgi:hypothetical protein